VRYSSDNLAHRSKKSDAQWDWVRSL